jgi:hypothetical protein
MDDKLLNEFIYESKKFISIVKLTDIEISEIQSSITDNFGIDVSRNWCWESISVEHKTIEYGKEDGLKKIKELLNKDVTVLLVVTDEETPPWFGFKGKLFDFIEVLKKLRYFEFFIIDEKCLWIIFDTHHNSFIITSNCEG